MSNGNLNDPGRAKLDVYLAELEFVFEQMHARMQLMNQYVVHGILFFTVVLGAVVVNIKTMIDRDTLYPLLLIPIPC